MSRARRTCAGKIQQPDGSRINCPSISVREGRCERHAAEYEAARGNRQSRGYDRMFDQARRKAAGTVAAGRAVCWRCGEAIMPGDEWDLGHGDGGSVAGPEHRRTCNLRAAGLKAAGRAWSAPQSKELTDAQTRAAR